MNTTNLKEHTATEGPETNAGWCGFSVTFANDASVKGIYAWQSEGATGSDVPTLAGGAANGGTSTFGQYSSSTGKGWYQKDCVQVSIQILTQQQVYLSISIQVIQIKHIGQQYKYSLTRLVQHH